MRKYCVWMSSFLRPLSVRDAITLSMAPDALAWAAATVVSWASTPTKSTAMSGVTLTSPVPVTQMPVFWPEAAPAVVRGGGEVMPSQPVAKRIITVSNKPRVGQSQRFIATSFSPNCSIAKQGGLNQGGWLQLSDKLSPPPLAWYLF